LSADPRNGGGTLLAAERLDLGRGRVLLAAVDLALRAGEGWFVLGRNGSGKSTLVATLLGLLPPLGGALHRGPALAGRGAVGYVPQEQRFDPPLPCTAGEFVDCGLDARTPRAAASALVTEALAAMQVEDLRARPLRGLSLGQRRRVLVARSLARRPRLLVLDEPCANLDAPGAARLARDLDALRREHGLCIVHVTHDLALARRFATHVALVAGGRVEAGPGAELLAGAAARAELGEDEA
jgi:ABC-type Mn2+/Zn2+ transport system ATPase subunit